MLAVPLIVFTVGILLADTVRTEGWTLARQNLGSLVGRGACGLAEDASAAVWSTAVPLESQVSVDTSTSETWAPPSPISGLARFELGTDGRAATPWFRLPANGRFGVFVAGSDTPSERLEVEWGAQKDDGVTSLEAAPVTGVQPRIETIPWTFLAASELPPRSRTPTPSGFASAPPNLRRRPSP